MLKRCPKCGEVKDLETGFFKTKKKYHKDGHRYYCKKCEAKIQKEWSQKNREKVNKKNLLWRERNREKARECSSKWAINNPEKVKANYNEWLKHNKEKVKALNTAWYKINSERMKEEGRKKVLDLNDSYIKKMVIARLGLTRDEVTPEIIKLKRSIILLHRELKTAKEARKCQAM